MTSETYERLAAEALRRLTEARRLAETQPRSQFYIPRSTPPGPEAIEEHIRRWRADRAQEVWESLPDGQRHGPAISIVVKWIELETRSFNSLLALGQAERYADAKRQEFAIFARDCVRKEAEEGHAPNTRRLVSLALALGHAEQAREDARAEHAGVIQMRKDALHYVVELVGPEYVRQVRQERGWMNPEESPQE
jgi:hypothetical protein